MADTRKAEYYKKNKARILANVKARYWAKREEICERSRNRRRLNRAAVAKQEVANRLRHIERYLVEGARRRAKKKGFEFSITEDDIYVPKVCPVLGIPLKSNLGTGAGPGSNSPTIDRVDNSKGYIPGNVIVISWKANCLKSSGTAEEIRKVVDWVELMESADRLVISR